MHMHANTHKHINMDIYTHTRFNNTLYSTPTALQLISLRARGVLGVVFVLVVCVCVLHVYDVCYELDE